MNYTDTHAHVYSTDFDTDRDEILQRGYDAGVRNIYMPNVDHTTIDGMLNVESRHAYCYPMMGLHPCSVKADFQTELYVVEDWLSKRKFAAVGEMGTDVYWDKTFWEQQKEAFRIQVGWAKKYKLPIVIHSRESIDETIALLEPLMSPDLTGIFHCFSGNAEQAKRIAAMGFYFGLGGVATFKNGGLDKVIPELPIDKIVLETDSPYLAPVPYRGKRNEPSYVPLIAMKVAEYRKLTLEELSVIIEANVKKIFQQ